MAERRMFTKKITQSDAFLEMPQSSQNLYFHLNMEADDDGFVNNPKRIQKLVGSSEDDMKILIVKSFIIVFESGVIVIKHWKMHNYIQADRYKPTDYVDEKSMLTMKKNKAYTLNESELYPECIHDVSIGKVRLGKVSIDKDILVQQVGQDSSNLVQSEEVLVQEPKKPKPNTKKNFETIYSIYPRKEGKAKAFEKYIKWITSGLEVFGKKEILTNEEIYAAVLIYSREKEGQDRQFIQMCSTFFNKTIFQKTFITLPKNTLQ